MVGLIEVFLLVLELVGHFRPKIDALLDSEDASRSEQHIFGQGVIDDARHADMIGAGAFFGDGSGLIDAVAKPNHALKTVVGRVFGAHHVAVVQTHAIFQPRRFPEDGLEFVAEGVGNLGGTLDRIAHVFFFAWEDNQERGGGVAADKTAVFFCEGTQHLAKQGISLRHFASPVFLEQEKYVLDFKVNNRCFHVQSRAIMVDLSGLVDVSRFDVFEFG